MKKAIVFCGARAQFKVLNQRRIEKGILKMIDQSDYLIDGSKIIDDSTYNIRSIFKNGNYFGHRNLTCYGRIIVYEYE